MIKKVCYLLIGAVGLFAEDAPNTPSDPAKILNIYCTCRPCKCNPCECGPEESSSTVEPSTEEQSLTKGSMSDE